VGGSLAVLCLIPGLALANGMDGGVVDAATADDDIIIIEEDTPPANPTGPLRPTLPDLPQLPEGFPTLPQVPPLPLGELTLVVNPADPNAPMEPGGRAFFGLRPDQVLLKGQLGLRSSLRPMGSVRDDLGRVLTDGLVALEVRPDLPFSFHLDVYTRVRGAMGAQLPTVAQLDLLDLVLPWRKTRPGGRFSGVLEVGEAYAALKVARIRVVVGRQFTGWSASTLSPLSSLLHPPDPRDGVAFPDELMARTAALAARVQTTLGPLAVEAVAMPFFVPPRVSLYAEDAEAFEPNELLPVLLPSRAALGDANGAAALQRQVPAADQLRLGDVSPTVGARVMFSLWKVDVALAGVFGHDPMPVLNTSSAVALALGKSADRANPSSFRAALVDACGSQPNCEGLDGALALSWRRTATLQADVSGTLGPAVVRGMAHVSPQLGPDLSRTAHVVHRDGRLESVGVWNAGTSVALESGYTELVQGSVEAGWEVTGGIPAGARLARYEAQDQARNWERVVHRPVLHARLAGSVLDDITWRLRATVAPWQREVFLAPRVGYRLSLSQEVTFGTEVFAGWPGTRGYFLQPLSRAYLEWAYRF